MRIVRKKSKFILSSNTFFIFATGFLLSAVLFTAVPSILAKANIKIARKASVVSATPSANTEVSAELIKAVLPDEADLGISLGDTVMKMVGLGAIDKEKFLALYDQRTPLSQEQKDVMEKPVAGNLVVNQANANFILNLLWPLGIANKSSVLSEGPMGTQYKKDIANFASTGGWTLGKVDGGKLFDSLAILPLTADQETEVKEIASAVFRPCCGNSTYFPDCNHGAAMLGFIELAVSQGMPKEQIYKKALILNSYWFPQTYIELATYFKANETLSWDKVDAKEVLSEKYSSGQGSQAIHKQLQDKGLIPQVKGGGGCGV